jgi:hypothetical protein
MASDPPDAADLCQPLLKELLIVSNNFNIEVRSCKYESAAKLPHWRIP